MSVDEKYTEELVETAEDGKEGYTRGAKDLADGDRPELAAVFTRLAQQRQQYAVDLRGLAGKYGDDVDEGGSTAAAVHRGWMKLKDAVTGSGPESILKTALTGEDHAIKEYEKALAEDLSSELRSMAEQQLVEIHAARGEVQGLLDAAEA
ncbi:PA2169 family four-helix-bundle protein [Nocardioides sp. KIGAM211]|uniref:PA2169 family four-helix-bundle protein n=1 Tax=Nocardioides luti TaxID=2761101 RepID=A0A7X0RCP9_9ACTN|nr:PA2169 family four-helix-bundle protein [Nocardioides luti]MBB6625866.1 PA2169 family four-helix-bundle protein [Nocardioides luti]